MATFRPKKGRVCELNFDDKYTYTLSLHEQESSRIANIADNVKRTLDSLTNTSGAEDEAYNKSLDAIDEILGEGASGEIMSLYDNPGLLDVADVILYITQEYKTAYEANLKAYKAQGAIPPVARGRR